MLQDRVAPLRLRALVMKTTLLDHLSLGPYKESVTIIQIQMPLYVVGRSFRPSGGSYAPGCIYTDVGLCGFTHSSGCVPLGT